jgi:hypothetical protein
MVSLSNETNVALILVNYTYRLCKTVGAKKHQEIHIYWETLNTLTVMVDT